MNWFKTIKSFYPKYWTAEMVADAVVAGKITPEQYYEITGLKYATDPGPEVPEEPPVEDVPEEPIGE